MADGASSLPGVGTLVAGKYRIERVLGEGGMAVVFAATHVQLDQRFALKFLLPELALRADIVQRFMREARSAVRIQSEHVARVSDVGVHEGAPYMVMEYLEGKDLARLVAERAPLPLVEAVGFVLQAAEAVAEAHALGIVHRDLKPANLFLAERPSGKPVLKVLDFGISKAPLAGREATITKGSALVGSPSYMSPEQLVAAADVDARSDLWSLGVVLYEMLGGKLPFDATTMPELVGAILQKAPDPLSSLRPDLPEGFLAVVDRCLRKEAGQRFRNLAEFAGSLASFGPPWSNESVERIRHVLGQAAPDPEPSPSEVTRPPAAGKTLSPLVSAVRPRDRRLVIAGPVAAALLLGGAVLWYEAGGGEPRPVPARAPAASDTSSSSAPPPTSATAGAQVAPAPAPSSGTEVARPPPTSGRPATLPIASPFQSRPSSRSPAARPRTPAPVATSSVDAGPCRMVSHTDENGDTYFTKECP